MIPEITPTGLSDLIRNGAPVTLLDVRQPHELDISRLEGILHIPLPLLATRLGELGKDDDIVVICRAGNRSGKMTTFLLAQGFSRVRNLAGGMNAWAETIDPTMETY